MEKLLEALLKQINLTEQDALIAALFAILGFSIDTLFFPAGLASSSVAILFGATGLLLARLLKSRRFFIERSLKSIDDLVAQGRLTPEQGQYYRQRIIEKWLESTKGVPRQDEQPQLPPKSD